MLVFGVRFVLTNGKVASFARGILEGGVYAGHYKVDALGVWKMIFQLSLVAI